MRRDPSAGMGNSASSTQWASWNTVASVTPRTAMVTQIEADDRQQPMAGEQRDAERQRHEAGLAHPEGDLIPSPRPRDGRVGDAGADHRAKVVGELPLHRQQRIQRPDVEVLEAVEPVALVVRRHARERAHVDVVVRARDVRVGVVGDVVLVVPEVGVAPQQVQRQRGGLVDRRVARVGAVVAVVLDVEADARHRQRERDRQRNGLPPGRPRPRPARRMTPRARRAG